MWIPAPSNIRLAEGDVHVWRATLETSRDLFPQFLASLAADERERAARFHFDRGRDGYIAARGVLRELLGKYLQIAPTAVRLAYTSHGKPELAPAHAGVLQFNLAHSGDLVLYAFARHARIGVDVEKNRPNFDGQRIADRFFAEAESSRLRAVGEADRVRAFTQQWTRKESFIKAHGEGLSYPLNAFSIEEDDNGGLRVRVSTKPGETDVWSVSDLEVGDNYAAAIAVGIPFPKIATFEWVPDDSHEIM